MDESGFAGEQDPTPPESSPRGVFRRWADRAGSAFEAFVARRPMPVGEFASKALAACDAALPPHRARAEALALAEEVALADDERARALLSALASAGPSAESTAAKISAALAEDSPFRRDALLLSALAAPRRALPKLWMDSDAGVEFICVLRARMLSWGKLPDGLAAVEAVLGELLSGTLSGGALSTRRVGWDSPAMVLEKIVGHEQVHKMGSIDELKRRLDEDRELFALFHSGWPDEPLAFLEVALTRGIPAKVSEILDGPSIDPDKADSAIFYSINSPHAGLRGIPFGEDLIHRAVELLRSERPAIRSFCTLSPLPGLVSWARSLSESDFLEACGPAWAQARASAKLGSAKADFFEAASAGKAPQTPEDAALFDAVNILAARYLAKEGAGRPLDPVARFHLGNGARLERLCPLGDLSQKGLAQSWGMMANYLYDLGSIDRNKRLFADGKRATGWKVDRLSRRLKS